MMKNLQATLRRPIGSIVSRVFSATGRTRYSCSVLALLFFAISALAQTVQQTSAPKPKLATAYGHLPLYFEKNIGQTADEVKFLSRGAGYLLYLTSTETVLDLRSRTAKTEDLGFGMRSSNSKDKTRKTAGDVNRSIVRMKFVGTNTPTEVKGLDEAEAKINYFIGNDPQRWLADIPTFRKVKYSRLYPGIDVVYYGNQGRLEYDLNLEPNADPDLIRIGIAGTKRLSLTRSGDLMMETDFGKLVLQKPRIYQLDQSQKRTIRCSYVLRGTNELGIQIGAYDRKKPLVVDPILEYSTFLGGTGQNYGWAGTTDSQGNVYITGGTTANDFPTNKAFGAVPTDASEVAFVSKVNASGTAVVFSTILGGGNATTLDEGYAAAVDSNGYVYITGVTTSAAFPVTTNAYQSTPAQGAKRTVFVTKLSADGQSLLYSTYLGGGGDQWVQPLAVDAHQVVYIGGATGAQTTFPTTPNAYQTTNRAPGGNAFVSKIDTTLAGANSLVYSTLLGGSTGNGLSGEALFGLAVDSSAKVYVTGFTFCTDFPVTSTAYQSTSKAQTKMSTSFLSEIDTTRSGAVGLVYSTYFGGSAARNSGELGDEGRTLTLDATGKAYVAGFTMSGDFPVTVGTAPSSNSGQGFIAKFDLTKSNSASLIYSAVFANNYSGTSYANSIAVDSIGDAYVGGSTANVSFPTTPDAVQSTLKSTGGNGFLSIFSADASTILYSTYLGSSGTSFFAGDGVESVGLDPSGNIYVVGFTDGIDLPTTQQTYQPTLAGTIDAFIAKFGGLSTPTIGTLSSNSGLSGTAITISGLNFGSSQGSVTFNGVSGVPTSWTSTSIVVPVPAGAKSGNIVVTAGGVPSNGVPFAVLPGPTPIVLVQHTSAPTVTTTTLGTLAFVSNNSAGNWIGVCIRASGTNQNLSVSDSNGNLYRQALSVNETGGGNTLAIFYAENIVAGPNKVTVSDTVSSNLQIIILEYSGIAAYGSL